MPAPVRTITGGEFRDPLGVAVTGALALKLSQDAKVTATGQIAPRLIRITLTAGSIASTAIFYNDELTPSGTFYTVEAYDSGGARVYGPQKWELTGAGPIDLGTIAPLSVDPLVTVTEPAVNKLFFDQANKDVVLDRAAANVLRLGAGDTFSPAATGQDLGSPGARWDLFGQVVDVAGNATIAGETIGTLASGFAQFRARLANFGTMIRNDDVDTYILLTASGDPLGGFNALRPFRLENATGNLALANEGFIFAHAGFADVKQIAVPANPLAGTRRFFVDSADGKLKVRTSAGASVSLEDVPNDTSTQRVEVVKNSGAVVGTRKQLNLIEGNNITLTVADDAINNQVDVTVAVAAAAFDPTTTVEWYDEFMPADAQVGEKAWRQAVGSTSARAGVSGRPGILRITTGAVSGDDSVITQGDVGDAFGPGNRGNWQFVASAKPVESAAVTYRIGMTTGAIDEPSNGIYFRATNGGSWFAVTRAAAVETATDTTIPATLGTFVALKAVMNAAGTSVEFFVNGVSRATHTANIPSASLSPAFSVNTSAAVIKSLDIDYFFLKITGLSR